MTDLTHSRLRQIRLNIAYKQSDQKLNEELVKLLGSDYRLHIRHHSHMLATPIKNAQKYDKTKFNGITVLVLEHPTLEAPIYSYSVTDYRDTYSRLVGRVLAKERILNQLQGKQDKQILEHRSDKFEIIRYVNTVVKKVSPRVKQAAKDDVHPLFFAKEDNLAKLVKLKLASSFPNSTIDLDKIMTNFTYVRSYDNKFYSGNLGTLEFINECKEKHPEDNIQLNSNGGVVVGCLTFDVDGVKHVCFSAALCLPVDPFNKTIGRKIVYNRMLNNPQIFKMSGEDISHEDMINNIVTHALATFIGRVHNTYIGTETE